MAFCLKTKTFKIRAQRCLSLVFQLLHAISLEAQLLIWEKPKLFKICIFLRSVNFYVTLEIVAIKKTYYSVGEETT